MKGNFKVKCIKGYKPGEWLTKGNVYEFVNGKTTYDDGCKSFIYDTFEHFQRDNKTLSSCLVEIKEEEKEMSNFKVKCTRGIMPGEWFTTGKTYEVKDGRITKDNGKEHDKIIKNINDLHRFFASQFELIEEKYTIVIHTKGNETVATLKQGKEVIKTAKAKCNPSDEFNFEIGAKLAFERLMGTDTKTINATLDTSGLENSLSNLREAFKKASGNPVNKPSIKIVKQDKYEVGDKVKIVDKWISGTQSSFGEMDKWLGKVMTIKRNIGYCYKMNEDVAENIGKGWVWSINDIEGKIIEESESPKFDWDGFKQGKFAVHCDTEEKAKQLFNELKIQCIKWSDGEEISSNNTYWEKYKEKTCYGTKYSTSRGLLGYGTADCAFDDIPVIPYIPNYREVKRPAKVGEWVKVVNALYACDCYKNGDILLVTRVHEDDGFGVYVNTPKTHKAIYCESNESFLWTDEYVVLDNYQPTTDKPVEQPFKKAKVGDKIKIVKDTGGHGPKLKIGDIHTVTEIHGDCVSTDMMNVLYDEHHEYIILEESKQDNTINVGDTVEVVNAGSCYSTYPRWFDDFAPKYSSKYSYGNSVKNGFVGNVVAKHKHHDYNNTIYAIQNGDRAVYLMSEKGIKKIHQ